MYATVTNPLRATHLGSSEPAFIRCGTVSHYDIIEKIGCGSMGVVFKARDLRLGRPVALKFLSPDLKFDAQAKQRFVHEAMAASALDHPNICTIYEIAESESGQVFIAMAYYEGESLQKQLKQGPLQLAEAIDIAIQTAGGLAKLHSQGIIHQDIKPANILFTNEGIVKIIDFGLAKLGSSDTAPEGTIVGTPAYMSPEQIGGREIDCRTDIWSLGVVVYEMITGRVPFGDRHYEALLYSILNEDAKPLKHFRADSPDELEEIVRSKTLAKKVDQRYQMADELRGDLAAVRRKCDAQRPMMMTPSGRVKGACEFVHLTEAVRNAAEPTHLFALLDQAGVASFVVEPSGCICYWSRQAQELLGFSEDQVLERKCAKVLQARDRGGCSLCGRKCQILALAHRGAQVFNLDLHAMTASGQRTWLKVSTVAAPVRKAPSPLVVHLMQDVPNATAC